MSFAPNKDCDISAVGLKLTVKLTIENKYKNKNPVISVYFYRYVASLLAAICSVYV